MCTSAQGIRAQEIKLQVKVAEINAAEAEQIRESAD
jgi:hypothetical protein